jgi:succinyl-CoA synthetase beta subunit
LQAIELAMSDEPMVLLEDAVKRRLQEHDVEVPRGRVVTDGRGAAHVATEMGGRVVVKALVPVGDRGRKGLVEVVSDARQAETVATRLLGSAPEGHVVERLLVEEMAPDGADLFVGFGFDLASRRAVLLVGDGGSGVEDRQQPTAIPFPLHDGPALQGFDGPLRSVIEAGYDLFRSTGAMTLEFNPVRVTGPAAIVLDGKVVLDPTLEAPPDAVAVRPVRAATTHERALQDADAALGGSSSLRYRHLDGDVALITLGGGALMVTHDALRRLGGRSSVASDAAVGRSFHERIALLLDTVLPQPTRGVFIGSTVSGLPTMFLAPTLHEGLIRNGYVDGRIPVVVRLAGEQEAETAALLESIPGIIHCGRETSIERAIELLVSLMDRELV